MPYNLALQKFSLVRQLIFRKTVAFFIDDNICGANY